MRLILPKLLLILGIILFASPDVIAADQASQSEYEEQVAKAAPDKNPAAHKSLAEWCKRKYPSKQDFHLQAWNLYEFARSEKLLPASPSLIELQRIANLADKMGLAEKARVYRGRWGETQFTVFAKKLKPGNTEMMKQLLDWSIQQKVEFIPPCQELARNIIAVEPEFVPARKALNHMKLSNGWKSWEEALTSIDLQSAPDRLEFHKIAAEQRVRKEASQYPDNPTRSMQSQDQGYFKTVTKTEGAPYFVWTKNYSRSRPCPLVICLHGGGEGGLEKAGEYASLEVVSWNKYVTDGSWVMISPLARNHISNSWWDKENLEDAFDMIEETVDQFNIDRKRIYVTGTSMGGNGTGQWMWAFPELAAASCARAGAYWTNGWPNIRDLLGKPIMVIHGEQDEPGRNVSRDAFLKITKSINGKITHISYPEQGHGLKWPTVFAPMIPFLLEHTNEIEPDFRLLREVFRDRHKRYALPK